LNSKIINLKDGKVDCRLQMDKKCAVIYLGTRQLVQIVYIIVDVILFSHS
jgi:hypothetical protein